MAPGLGRSLPWERSRAWAGYVRGPTPASDEGPEMTKQLRCADVTGNCDAVVTGESDEEILEQAIPHAKEAHGMANSQTLRETLTEAIEDA